MGCCRYDERAGLRAVLEALLPPADAHAATSARKPALAVLSLLRKATQPMQLPLHAAHVRYRIKSNRFFRRSSPAQTSPARPKAH